MSMRRTVVFAICLLVLVPASLALAQGSDLPARVVPCDGTSIGGGRPCSLCDLVALAQNLINVGIFITITLSAMMFAVAGGMYLTAGGDTGQVGKARGIFKHVAVGLIIILMAWLGVDTLMKTMVDQNQSGGMGPWNAIGCSQTASFIR